MPTLQTAPGRKDLGDYPTPGWLVDLIVEQAVPPVGRSVVRVVDPACGDGRFLLVAGERLRSAGVAVELVGMDLDGAAVAAARKALDRAGFTRWHVDHGDALGAEWATGSFDVVVGNPPYLSQLATTTTRGGSSRHGGGPYADAAVEFLALAARLVRPDGGRIGLVLPQSVLASRDAASVRAELDRRAERRWSWWSPRRVFDAQVLVCALVFEARRRPLAAGSPAAWSSVVTAVLGVPELPRLSERGVLGDHSRLTANFRDQYYGLVPAVVEDGGGPPFVTSGLVDAGRCTWGERPVTFARHRFCRPTVDLDRLGPALRRWADELLVPKVVVANQTRVIEAAADDGGRWLPGVPLITARPTCDTDVWSVAAALTSPVASAWAWHRAGGSGLSATSLRLGPRWLAELPWPAGDLGPAVEALRRGEVAACGRATLAAYGAPAAGELLDWWTASAVLRPPHPVPVPGRESQPG